MPAKISVIIPVYNAEKYLCQCLDSIINQSFKDIEIICINDGSTDSSAQILSKYANSDPRIKLITQQNRGQALTRNIGIDIAEGEFIAFFDADDWLELNCLEKAFNALNNTDCDFLAFRYNFKDCARDVIYYQSRVSKQILTSERDRLALVIFYSFPVWNKLYRLDFLRNNNLKFPAGLIFEDINFTITSSLLAKKIITIPDYLYNYRLNPKSTTANKGNNYIIIKMYQDLINLLKEKRISLKAQNVVKSLMYFQIYSHRQSTSHKFIKHFENELTKYLNLEDYKNSLNNAYLPIRIKFYYLYIFNKVEGNKFKSLLYWCIWQFAKLSILPRKLSGNRIQMAVDEEKLLKSYND